MDKISVRDYEELAEEAPVVKVKINKKSKKQTNDKTTFLNKKKSKQRPNKYFNQRYQED
jgi:hypothetical protein